MDQDSAHMVAASKVPMLKPGEYEIWRMRIEQYIQMIDYALWEVIENGATLPKTKIIEGVMTEMPITTAEIREVYLPNFLKMIKPVLLVKRESSTEPLVYMDEISGILKSFITGIENLVDHKVKVIRCDNRTEFKNREMNQFCEMKGILRQFSVARTPQQNKVAERRNMTLIEAARTMLADSKLPTTFWAEAVNTACYVQNKVLIVNAAGTNEVNSVDGKTSIKLPIDPCMPALEDYNIFDFLRDDEDDGVVADMNNLDTTIQSATLTRKMSKNLEEHEFEEPKKVIHALKSPSWIEAKQGRASTMTSYQKFWTLVDLTK
ncbi:putative ribonuclease H-like domain-containing protein [Tanacetum coccineum]